MNASVHERYHRAAKHSSENSTREALTNRYKDFQKSQEFLLDNGVTFNVLTKRDDFHAGGVFIFAMSLALEMTMFSGLKRGSSNRYVSFNMNILNFEREGTDNLLHL